MDVQMCNESIDLKTLHLMNSACSSHHGHTAHIIKLLNEASPDKNRLHFQLLGLKKNNPFRNQLGIKENRLYPAGEYQKLSNALIKVANEEGLTLSFVDIAIAYEFLTPKHNGALTQDLTQESENLQIEWALEEINRIRQEQANHAN